MDYLEKSGLDVKIVDGRLAYKKEDYQPAVDWEKSFEAGKYAYKSADNLQTTDNNIDPIYFGARYMEKTVDEDIFLENDLMADATVLMHGNVDGEYIKTVGHYHGHIQNSDLSYPEVYEAISEKIEYLLQSEPDANGEIDVIWVVTESGDKVVMPPNYGHVSLNAGTEPALEVDIQKRDNPDQSDYSMFKENVGGALYRTGKGLEENPNYKIKSLRIVRPKEVSEWGLTKNVPLYTSVVNNPEKFKWLTKPQDFEFDFDKLFEDAEL